ncbi:MAG: MFS transporter, partial [Verrucomicrobiota bacterium]|nr:MFS transporter [Verrucomicrobiota bacterium]
LAAGKILFLSSTAFLGGLSSLWFLGARLDKLGSKPILTFSFFTYLIILSGWIGLAGGVFRPMLLLLLLIQFLTGLSAALISMANTRLAMAIVPVMGRNHFFALYSVIGSLTLGLSPILWGLFIDLIGPIHFVATGIIWNRYSIFFAAVALAFCAAIFLAAKLEEPEAASMEELLREILIQTPQRVWIRLWPRE